MKPILTSWKWIREGNTTVGIGRALRYMSPLGTRLKFQSYLNALSWVPKARVENMSAKCARLRAGGCHFGVPLIALRFCASSTWVPWANGTSLKTAANCGNFVFRAPISLSRGTQCASRIMSKRMPKGRSQIQMECASEDSEKYKNTNVKGIEASARGEIGSIRDTLRMEIGKARDFCFSLWLWLN